MSRKITGLPQPKDLSVDIAARGQSAFLYDVSSFLFFFVCFGILRPSQQRGHVELVS